MKLEFYILTYISLSSSLGTVENIKCYRCHFDTLRSRTMPFTNPECLKVYESDNFDGNKVAVEKGHEMCFVAVTQRGRKIEVASRGGRMGLYPRNIHIIEDNEAQLYNECNKDLCNDGSILHTPKGLIMSCGSKLNCAMTVIFLLNYISVTLVNKFVL